MSSAGSLIGSDASLGSAAHAPTSNGKTHAIADSSPPRAPRMLSFLFGFPRKVRGSSRKEPTRARAASLPLRPDSRTLAVARRDDCYLLASAHLFCLALHVATVLW